MAKLTLLLISMVLMLVLVERTVSFTAVDASWGKRSEKVRSHCTFLYLIYD